MSSFFLLGALSLLGLVQGQVSAIASLKEVALTLNTPLTCAKMNCDCAFTSERSCCCGASDMYQTENYVYERMKDLYMRINKLKTEVQELTTERKVAFQAHMKNNIATASFTGGMACFGPFNIDVPIPFGEVLLNDYNGYNKALGTFTAPRNGAYVFSFTITSLVKETELMYHKVELVAEGGSVVAVWENNREDFQDSATQHVILLLEKGNQVYLRLVSGRRICTTLESNTFSGFMLYPVDN
ncbi:cerebellin 18 [Periophthalmus magnuspinnatus]|uniref:cerebellin 18 n=1 Tax=Periophthalmus magnuspinnatus TaxID=409849 RepID=UPI002436F80B|nr:cerebellin 18 [Periophthalmus magnuspinnatus]